MRALPSPLHLTALAAALAGGLLELLALQAWRVRDRLAVRRRRGGRT